MLSRWVLWITALGVALTLAALCVRPAAAHARLVRSNPVDGALLTALPRTITLWFDEPVAVALSSAELLDATGQNLGAVTLRADANDPHALIIELPAVSANGIYSLAWRILSAVDSHFTKGVLVFGVNQTVAPTAPAEVETRLAYAEIGLRLLRYLALSCLVGGFLVASLIARPHPTLQLRARHIGLVGVALGFVGGLFALAWQLSQLERGTLWELLQSRYGWLWALQQGLFITAGLALVADAGKLWWGQLSAIISILGLAVTQAMNGHAAGVPTLTVWAIVTQAVHLLAASAWLGSLGTLALLHWVVLGSYHPQALLFWRRFGLVAFVCVGVLLASGVFNTSRQVFSLDAWLLTPYGWAVWLKIGLFLVAGTLGLLNSAALHARAAKFIHTVTKLRLASGPPRWITPEVLSGGLILLTTAYLTTLAPARGPEFVPPEAYERPPANFTLPVEDLLINLVVRPSQPGVNLLSIGVFNTRRPAPADVIRVQVRLRYLDRDFETQTLIAELEDEQRYRLQTNALSLEGRWQAQVVVRRSGLPDAVGNFEWQVAPLLLSVPTQPMWISNLALAKRWEVELVIASALSLTLLAVGLAIWQWSAQTE